jgi:N-methylhydantoinase A
MGELSRALGEAGIRAELQVMQSRGGLTTADIVSEKPVTMLLSGPASGVIGGRYTGVLSRLPNVITVDIGGTSCDVALVKEGKALISREGRIASYPLRISMVDVNTVGAGGGSLAWLDGGGGLHVGPESAGSDPGPICYGRGGQVPTVTDASLVLGYLNPGYFAGGELGLDLEAARAGMARMARELSMKPEVLAAGIHRIINERMANEIRLVSVKRGYDPRQFSLVPLGGAGPVHGGRLAALLSIPTVVVPEAPGVLSAFGLLVANIEHEQTRTLGARLDEVAPERVEGLFTELDAICAEKMARENVAPGQVHVQHHLDIRYIGQSYELEVALNGRIDRASLDEAGAEFHRLHERIYGYRRADNPVEAINLRSVHTVEAQGIAPEQAGAAGGSLADALKEPRPVYFDEVGAYRETPVYERRLLPLEETLRGPAVIEQVDTTTILYPGHVARLDAAGNLIITIAGENP